MKRGLCTESRLRAPKWEKKTTSLQVKKADDDDADGGHSAVPEPSISSIRLLSLAGSTDAVLCGPVYGSCWASIYRRGYGAQTP